MRHECSRGITAEMVISAVDETLAVDRHLYGPRHEEGKQDED